jgi:hypothetical protein
MTYQSGEGVRTSPEGPKGVQVGDAIERVHPRRLKPAEINNKIYRPVSQDDPTIIDLAEDIKVKGVLEALVVTPDDVLVSGHCRRAAALLAGVETVPVRRIDMLSTDPRFPDYLTSYNRQRVKTTAEQVREEVVRTSPEDAHNALLAYRKVESAKVYQRAAGNGLRVITTSSARRRSAITEVKRPMLDAVRHIIDQYEDYWPLTLRQVHYRLLGKGVLRNARKPDSLYVNTEPCYKDLSNLLSRARLEGSVPWESMHDPTRPQTTWVGWDNVGGYMRKQLDTFLAGYKRDLLQSQPAYVELVVEKITVQDIAERAAGRYHVPVGVGRGYTSVTSLNETAERFRASGKDRFILLIAGDLDPEGENIAETWAACLQDEHGVEDITAVKVAVNPEQVDEYDLSPQPVKQSSSRAAAYKAAHGGNVYELEAFEPDHLQTIIREAIRNVLDLDLFAQEQRRESQEARKLMAYRKVVQNVLKDCDLEDDDEDDDEEE